MHDSNDCKEHNPAPIWDQQILGWTGRGGAHESPRSRVIADIAVIGKGKKMLKPTPNWDVSLKPFGILVEGTGGRWRRAIGSFDSRLRRSLKMTA